MEESTTERINQELDMLLEAAADGVPGAAFDFFSKLLESQVYVPLERFGGLKTLPVPGESEASDHGIVVVQYEGHDCVPIFTEVEYLELWAKREFPFQKQDFASLLWLIGTECWLYLNPEQEVGKELTNWELERLRKGASAIPELVNALEEEPVDEVEVDTATERFDGFKKALLPIFELSDELEEAFLIGIREPDSEQTRPALGLRYGKIKEEKRKYIRSEIEFAAEEQLREFGGDIFLIDDLEHSSNPHATLFEEVTPFYLGKNSTPKQKQDESSFLDSVKSRVRGLFTSKA